MPAIRQNGGPRPHLNNTLYSYAASTSSSMTIAPSTPLRIGVDVGGTNTDAVVLDLTPGVEKPVIATHKAPTTADITTGIQRAIGACLERSSVDRSQIQAVAIGTTSFVNSLIERDATKLQRVAVLRLCGPFSRLCPPFASFPYELRNVLEGPCFFAKGGLQVDGSEIEKVDPLEIRGIAAEMRRLDVQTIAVSSCYAPIDLEIKQEELVRDILQAELPGVRVTISKDVANIGLLERENAAILNAALLAFAEKTVAAFLVSIAALGLTSPVFLTSNDGTLMTCQQAARLPIRTFSSGPTNSMRGANFLAGLVAGKKQRETALVIDVGGTTTEIGVLLPTGFPRQAGAFHSLCGVPLNFSMPHVYSIGLGGGSRVRTDARGRVTVGPDSVGYRITDEALCFGGSTGTATDIAVATGRAEGVGNTSLVTLLNPTAVIAAEQRIRHMIELAIDSMKTSSSDIPVYLVGGGAILVPDELKGVSEVVRFPHYDAANAVGAACAQISGVVDTVEDTTTISVAEAQKAVEKRAIERAIAQGADPNHTVVVESEVIPIAYATDKCRFYVKAAGEWRGRARDVPDEPKANGRVTPTWDSTTEVVPIPAANGKRQLPTEDPEITAYDIRSYRPTIVNKEWFLSEVDLEWIAAGCYILGTGGGGNPQTTYLEIRELVRAGANVRVIDIDSVANEDHIVPGANIGAPEVGLERLGGPDPSEGVYDVLKLTGHTSAAALTAIEIGGGNGMVQMITGASNHMNLPVLDGDFMGRAYPTGWQSTLHVFDESEKGELVLPVVLTSGDGTTMHVTKVKDEKDIDRFLRAGCIEMGTAGNIQCRPLSKGNTRRMLIRNTVSQAWRLGRAVALAKKQSNIGRIGQILVDAVGGSKAGRVLFVGKIVEVGRKLHKGHSYGEVVIQALSAEDEEDDDEDVPREKFEGVLKIPFKNENLLAEHTVNGNSRIVAGVPDLISIIDAQNGVALGTPEYKYGLRVLVLGITAAPQWTSTQRGLDLGSLTAFGYDEPYVPLGEYVQPRSVIEEFA
ncbi:Putative D-/L-hydantoinase subunit A [Vanrija pseudolonga]|uniref:D-/L-hydantoinase subunit A n=1 Tax=Vanrija pseudolonga TaxID=143232 RepID=A0AAF0Y3D9_9TREE|nr:Putative D-/L-hydantoinase subunit A [Vanrija pseudolonga]